MKKLIFALSLLFVGPVFAEVADMDANKELFIDKDGLYRYTRAEDVYQKNCHDSPTEEVRSKCMAAEKAVWARGKTPEEIKKQGTLFSGKLKEHFKGKEKYFYVKEGKKSEQINILLNEYYFENGLLYDIKTEEPFTGEIVIGGVEGLVVKGEKAPRYIAQQKYENGVPVGAPELVSVE